MCHVSTIRLTSSTIRLCSPTQGVPTYHSLVQFQPVRFCSPTQYYHSLVQFQHSLLFTYQRCTNLPQFGSVPAQFGSVHLPKVYQLTTVWFSSSTVWFCSPTQGVPTYHSLVQFQPDLGSITNNQLQLHFQLRLLSEVNYNYTVLISQFNYNYNYNYNSMCYCNSMGGVYQSVCTGGKFKFFLSKRGVN